MTMKTYKGNSAFCAKKDGHTVYIKLRSVDFNYAIVTIHVQHRKGQCVTMKFHENYNFNMQSEDWDVPSGYCQIAVNTRPYNTRTEMLEDVFNSIKEVKVFIDFTVEDRVTYELLRALA